MSESFTTKRSVTLDTDFVGAWSQKQIVLSQPTVDPKYADITLSISDKERTCISKVSFTVPEFETFAKMCVDFCKVKVKYKKLKGVGK